MYGSNSLVSCVVPHLPVFLQKTMVGDIDSQLVNSVYLDNYAMELYHGRLDKSPGAIALRFRWSSCHINANLTLANIFFVMYNFE